MKLAARSLNLIAFRFGITLIIFLLMVVTPAFALMRVEPRPTFDIVLYNYITGEQRYLVTANDNQEGGLAHWNTGTAISDNFICWLSKGPSTNTISYINLTDGETYSIKKNFNFRDISLYKNELLYYADGIIYTDDVIGNAIIRDHLPSRDDLDQRQITDFNDRHMIIREQKGTISRHSLTTFDSSFNTTEYIGAGYNYDFHEDSLLFAKTVNGSNNISIRNYNLTTNTYIEYYNGSGKTDVIGISENYAAWRLQNGTFSIFNKTSGDLIYGFENNIVIREYSFYKGIITYIDESSYGNDELVLYDILSGNLTRLTFTKNREEGEPKIHGNYIIWITWVPPEKNSGFDIFFPLLFTVIIIAQIHKKKRYNFRKISTRNRIEHQSDESRIIFKGKFGNYQ